MIIVRLRGGLGNQMFQYAVSRALTDGQVVFIDLSFLTQNTISSNHFTARSYELQVFKNLKVSKINQTLLRFLLSESPKYKLLKKLLPKRLKSIKKINDDNFHLKLKYKQILLLDGYFQNPFFFETIRKTLLKDFKFPTLPENLIEVFNKINKSNHTVGIHVRRGDYLNTTNQTVHGVLPIDYYKKAIEFITNKIANPTYFIFSDDPNWCQTDLSFIEINYQVVSGSYPAWADMYLMSLCQHQIIANSSFSWWAAWLNEHEEKIVIAPKTWFVDDLKNSETETLIPSKWIRV
jgi:hypothetical protein